MHSSIRLKQFLLFITIIFTHFTVFKVGFSFTVLFIITPLLLITLITKIKILKKYLPIMSIVYIYPFVVLLFYDTFFYNVNYIEFIKTYLLYFYSFSILFIVLSTSEINLTNRNFLTLIKFIQYILLILGILQISFYIYFHNPIFFNPFGPFQYLYLYDYTKITRASLFYLEPSFAAFVSFALYNSRLILEKKITITNFSITAILMVLIGSATGQLLFILMTIFIFYKFDYKYYFKDNNLKFIVLVTIAVLLLILIISNFERINELFRFSTFMIEGTSAFWRWILPLYVIEDMFLSGNYFGIAFGQLEAFVQSYGIFMGGKIGTSIDNGLLLILIYFGSIGLIGFIIVFYKLIKSNRIDFIIILGAIFSLVFNGAIVYIDYVFYGLILTLMAKKARTDK